MRVFFIGDIVGKPGRRAVRELLPGIVSDYDIDCVIANCENAAAGFGVTREIVEELFKSNIDVLTSGNHIWDKKEINEFIGDFKNLLRPANYPAHIPGVGSVLVSTRKGNVLGVLNLEGRIFMQPLDCPFRAAEIELGHLKERTKIIVVDFHAEATSEKKSMGWFLDGRVSAVIGTHTHVQTADESILPEGTAYITDAGMTGAFDSVIGIKKEDILTRFLTLVPNKFNVAKGDVRLQGVLLEIDEETGKCKKIERLTWRLER